jgi:Peptidase family M1 domain
MMKRTRKSFMVCYLLAAIFIAHCLPAAAASSGSNSPPWQIANGNENAGLYMPREVQQAVTKGTRSANGQPGKNYWQNEATHKMRITLNPPSKRVQGEQEIVYINNSPDALPILIFRLYANAHQAEAIREKAIATAFLADGITVDEFSIDGVAKPWNDPASPLASINVRGSTVHGIALDKPLLPKSSVRIRMRWHYDLVADAGWKEGAIGEGTFFLAYFFPRVTNYSDYNGWDYSPFTLGREFNNDFADFDVAVDVPRDYVVWATGTLQNPDEVLQSSVARKLAESFNRDEIVTLAEAADIKAGKVTARGDRLTWKWQASHVPDFALAVSNNYRWQASSVVVDPVSKRRTSVQAAYADSATDFRGAVESARKALQFASTKYPGVPYPYPKTTLVLGSADEEYPMMVNDASVIVNPTRTPLPEFAFSEFVAAHEILHSWFPFYMGINEKRYPFMDEGWTSAFEYFRNREVLGVPTANALFSEFRAGGWTAPTSSYELPIITPHDAMWGQSAVFGFNQYGKAAMGFIALKDLMGDAAFRTGLHEFMTRWQGKRPLPWDMFNSFNDAGVGDYTWFFNNWFFSYNHSDLSLTGVQDRTNGVSVAVHNPGGMAIPFDLVLNYTDGSTERVHRTPAAWQADARKTLVPVASGKFLKSITLDTGIFPDANPIDNTWTSKVVSQL